MSAHRIARTVPLGVAIVVSVLAFFTPGPDLPTGPDISDKVEHAAIFAALAITGRIARIAVARLAPALVGYAVLSEILQGVLPIQRDGDWHDVVADTVGMLVGLVLATLALRRR